MDEEKPTVIVVDDDESVRKAMKRLLVSNGYEVVTFESAEELLLSNPVWDKACLLLDIRLPGMSGFDLYARLLSAGVECPVIFMTAHADAQWLEKAEEGGAMAFPRKPFGEQSLLSALALARDKEERTYEDNGRGIFFALQINKQRCPSLAFQKELRLDWSIADNGEPELVRRARP